jgi:uncharacterized damage-inducible protein DinB
MLDEYRELIDFLAQTPTQLKDSAAAASDPPEGEWSAAQVIGHLAACEFYFVERLNRLLREDSPHLRAFGTKAFECQESMMDASVDSNLQAFNELRGESVSMLMSLALNLWDRAGTYESEGKMSIEDVVELMIDHDAEHLAQIEALAMATK